MGSRTKKRPYLSSCSVFFCCCASREMFFRCASREMQLMLFDQDISYWSTNRNFRAKGNTMVAYTLLFYRLIIVSQIKYLFFFYLSNSIFFVLNLKENEYNAGVRAINVH
eukprot:GEMP01094790.1.p1 GENE.GEMP01094790.1~~GEMP01094790.1.p1  ORF type:complete len:110 (+),score=2.09 GEMP01094790.1:531-860(+)